MIAFNRRLALLLAIVPLGCSGVDVRREVAPEFAMLREAGLRIAVMPFATTAPQSGFLGDALESLGGVLALSANSASPPRERVAGLLRADVVGWLQQTGLEVVEPWHIDTQLAHAKVSPEAARSTESAAGIAQALGVDAVLYGDVTRWNRSYYVVQSFAEVGLHLTLVDAGGRRLFETERAESLGAGIGGGPTGYVSAVTAPLAGLSGEHLRELTRSITRNAVADLNGGELGVVPGPLTPKLTVVGLAATHDGPFRIGERVEVIAVGSPGCEVRFDIGRLRTEVPMVQTSVMADPRGDRATYVGHYVLQPGDTAVDLPLGCTIRRGAARRSLSTWYRWERRLSLDAR
ncbi:MAG: hypothetical protein KDE27_09700 [Planctomycetes bacterium]|nr:hypothetical protein [Planctomycetota bacterium]